MGVIKPIYNLFSAVVCSIAPCRCRLRVRFWYFSWVFWPIFHFTSLSGVLKCQGKVRSLRLP